MIRDGLALPLPASKKTRALLGYLAASGRPHLRERLCSLLWDGPDDPRAALRWSLTKLRPIVDTPGTQRLVADRERVELVAAEIDLSVIRAVGSVANVPTEQLRALSPYLRGELLEGLDLPDCFRYDEWLRPEREAVRGLQVAIARTLVERVRGESPAEALAHAHTWIGLDPLNEGAHAAAVGVLVELDRKADALGAYTRCARLFERELGRGPSRELERLRMAIGAVSVMVAEPVVEAPAASSPLIGRTQERAVLDASLVTPRARVTLLLGDPGIGKTRLLDELATLAGARGMTVLRGRGVEAELVRPFGAWLDAVAGTGVDPFHTAVAKDTDRGRLFESVTAWLIARGPLLVIVDDLQWIDEASAALLHYIARTPTAASIRLACGARPGELADNVPALRLVRGLTREGAVHQIGVSPLGREDTAALALLHAPGVDAARVVAESGGHPLFALEIARALARGETTWSSLESLLAERLELVEGIAREIVPWAAAFGGAFDPELLALVTGVPLVDLVRAVGELERRTLVRASGVEWDFAHDLIRAAAYQSISAPRRRLLHLQIARVIAALPDPDGARAVQVAHHASLGGDALLCVRASVAACERCLRMFAPEEAATFADRGLAHVAALVGEERAQLRIDLLVGALAADVRRARRVQIATELRRAIVDGRAAGAVAAVTRGCAAMAQIAFESNDFAGAGASVHDGAAHARSADSSVQGRVLAHTAHCLALIGREMSEAEQLAGEAAELLADTSTEVPELSFGLALIRHHQGDLAGAITLLDRSIDLGTRSGQHWFVGLARARGALFAFEHGRPALALDYCAALREMAAVLGECAEIPCGRVIEAASHIALGNGETSMLEHALADLRGIDAPALLASTLVCIAERELATGNIDDAMHHAAEAITAATRASRATELVRARGVLVRIAEHDGRADAAASQREALAGVSVETLGARARAIYDELSPPR